MSTLQERVEAEFENIEQVFAELPSGHSCSELSKLELAGVAALLHNFYNGIENILKQVVQGSGLALPTGDSWHRDLVDLAQSQAIISAKTAEELRKYLAFRHFFVHAYAFDLRAERMGSLVENVAETFDSFQLDIEQTIR